MSVETQWLQAPDPTRLAVQLLRFKEIVRFEEPETVNEQLARFIV
jgi:hypothetical protein